MFTEESGYSNFPNALRPPSPEPGQKKFQRCPVFPDNDGPISADFAEKIFSTAENNREYIDRSFGNQLHTFMIKTIGSGTTGIGRGCSTTLEPCDIVGVG